MPKILFICTGNTCRSPMAAAIAADLLKKDKSYTVSSRGLSVTMPSRASDYALAALESVMGLDISEHVSRQFKREDLAEAALVVTMTISQREYLKNIYRQYANKIFTLCELSGKVSEEIKDPYGRDITEYKKCAEDLRKYITEGLAVKLAEMKKNAETNS